MSCVYVWAMLTYSPLTGVIGSYIEGQWGKTVHLPSLEDRLRPSGRGRLKQCLSRGVRNVWFPLQLPRRRRAPYIQRVWYLRRSGNSKIYIHMRYSWLWSSMVDKGKYRLYTCRWLRCFHTILLYPYKFVHDIINRILNGRQLRESVYYSWI